MLPKAPLIGGGAARVRRGAHWATPARGQAESHAAPSRAEIEIALRPPVVQDRLEQRPDGLVQITPKRPHADTEGATARSSGELPWRTNFGAGLALLRHQRNDAALKELARVYVRDALKRWVPGAQLVSLSVEQDGPALTLRVRVRERDVAAAVDVSVAR